MSKIVRRPVLDDLFDIGRQEHWLSDMAAKGLHFKKIGISFAHFEKGEPKTSRYRIDITKDAPDEEQLAIYRDCGWHYVTKMGEMAIFCDNGDSSVPELHNDTMVQSYTFARLDKQLRRTAVIVAVLVLLIILMIGSLWFMNNTPILNMVTGQATQQTVLIVVECWVAATSLRKYRTIHKLRENLRNGVPINHNEPYKTRKKIDTMISAAVLTLAFGNIALPIMGMARSDVSTYWEPNTLPVVNLATLEQDPALVREIYPDPRTGTDHGNRVESEWSLLAPRQYSVRQGMTDGADYSPSLTQSFFEVSIPALAKPLLKNLQRRYIWERDGKPQEIFSPAADSIWMIGYPNDGRIEIFAQQGNRVLYLRYFGKADHQRVIDLMTQALSPTSDSLEK